MKTRLYWQVAFIVVAVSCAVPAAWGQELTFPDPPGVSGPALLPDFDVSLFGPSSATITNPYFPLTPGTVYTYRGEVEEDDEIVVETSRVFVTFDTRTIAGVESRVVRDTEFVNGRRDEDTFDWYAQDLAGNVWYMGELSTSFEYDDMGDLIDTSTEGSWEAGVDDAQPGYIMLAEPFVGAYYFNEFAPGEAVDQALVISLDETVSIDLGTFTDVLQVYETDPLDPEDREFNFYAPGIGQILTLEDLNENFMDPEAVFELQSVQVIPAPMSLLLAVVGLGCVGRMRRWLG
jgi:hypothetical protein